MMDVITPMMTIVRHENRKISIPKINKPAKMMAVSMMIMIKAISMEEDFEMNFANKSVPPLLVSYLSISPIPTPIITPPINELVRIETANSLFNGLNQSMKRDVKSNP